MITITGNVIADQNETAHWMVNVSLSLCYTKLYLRSLITTSEWHGVTNQKNGLETVSAWIR